MNYLMLDMQKSQRRIQDLERGRVRYFLPLPSPSPSFFSSLPSFSLPSPHLPLTTPLLSSPTLPFLFLSLPPIPFDPWGPSPFPARGLGSAVSSPSGVRGGAPAAKAILAYLAPTKRAWWQAFRSFLCDTKCLRQSLYYAVFSACYGYEI